MNFLITKSSAKFCLIAVVACGLLSSIEVTTAHHSFEMFDYSKNSSVAGSVAKIEWSNPHIWFWVYVHKQQGSGYDLLGFEAGSIGVLARAGWTSDTLKVGDKITVAYHPLKDGRNGGSFVSATFADGSKTPEAAGPGGAPAASTASK